MSPAAALGALLLGVSTVFAQTFDCTPPADGWEKEQSVYCCLHTGFGCSNLDCKDKPYVAKGTECPSPQFQGAYEQFKQGQTLNAAIPPSVAFERASADAIVPLLGPIPDGVQMVRKDVGGVPCDVYGEEDTGAAIIMLHGGGYIAASSKTNAVLAAVIARDTGMPVYVVDYTLAPELPMPGQLEEVDAVYKALLESGVEASATTFIGDSAGGGMSLLYMQKLVKTGRKAIMPGAAVLLSPWTNLANTGRSFKTKALLDPLVQKFRIQNTARAAIGDVDADNNEVRPTSMRRLRSRKWSPLFGSFRGLPPLFFIVGTNEILLSDTLRTAWKARIQNVDVTLHKEPNNVHVYPLAYNLFPEAKEAADMIADFIVERCA